MHFFNSCKQNYHSKISHGCTWLMIAKASVLNFTLISANGASLKDNKFHLFMHPLIIMILITLTNHDHVEITAFLINNIKKERKNKINNNFFWKIVLLYEMRFGSERDREKSFRSIVCCGVNGERKEMKRFLPLRPFNEMYQVCHVLYLTPFVERRLLLLRT